jgi:hypothetical protein
MPEIFNETTVRARKIGTILRQSLIRKRIAIKKGAK